MHKTQRTPTEKHPASRLPPRDAAPSAPQEAGRLVSFASVGAKVLFYALLLVLALNMTLAFSAHAALAQGGGAIEQAIQNAQDWVAGIMTTLGGLGLICSIGVKAIARTNENMHHAAHLGMTGSCIAVAAGILLPDILDLVQGFAGGGGA